MVAATGVHAEVLHVGPGQRLSVPSQAAKAAKDGDVIELAAGTYERDVATWIQNDLVICGVNGRAHLKAGGSHEGGKGLWVIRGRNTTIENVEFSEARVPEGNGAGLRLEGAGLTIRNCYFHDNENGILGGGGGEGDVVIEHSEFAANGAGDGQTHNIYIGKVRTLILRGSYSHHARIGHSVKSRAATTYLLCNRIMDEEMGTSSYAIDLPNGGARDRPGRQQSVGRKGERRERPGRVAA